MRIRYLFVVVAVLALMLAGCAAEEAPTEPAAPTAPSEPAPAEPAEPAAPSEPAEPAEDMMDDVSVEPVEGSAAEKEEGLVRSVACDADTNKITIKYQNSADEEWNLYEKVVPQPENAVKTLLNGRLVVGMTCDAETLAPGELVTCTAEDVMLRPHDTAKVYDQRLSVTGPDRVTDIVEFNCEGGVEEVESAEEMMDESADEDMMEE